MFTISLFTAYIKRRLKHIMTQNGYMSCEGIFPRSSQLKNRLEPIRCLDHIVKKNVLSNLLCGKHKQLATISSNDYDMIANVISEKFGDELFILFILHANGYTYDELAKLSGKSDLNEIFKIIRKYAIEELIEIRKERLM